MTERHFRMEALVSQGAGERLRPDAFVVDTPLALEDAERRYLAWAERRFGGS